MSESLEDWKARGPIRRWRDRTNPRVTQHELGVRVDTQGAVVADWEAGRAFPQWDSIVKLAGVFERDPANLEHALRKWWLENPTKVRQEVAS